jgi:nitroreductase
MNIKEAILKRRTIRKFQQEKIDAQILYELIDFARLAPTGINLQPLKFALIKETQTLNEIFPNTKWAGYLADGAPKEDERPAAYIAVLGDLSLKKEFQTEAGAAIANITVGALEFGLGSCWLGAINRREIMKILNLSEENYSLLYLVALGYPKQESEAEDICGGDIKYWEDAKGKIHVPKRVREEVIILEK